MNLRIGIILIVLLFLSCEKNESSLQNDEETGNCATGTSTATILVNIDEEIYNNDKSVLAYSKYSWSSDGTNRILNGNGIPNHKVGTFPNSNLSLIHISEPTRLGMISYAVFCLKKKKN